MKPVVIKESNADRIQAAIDEVQTRAKVRTITSHTVTLAVERIEEILGLPARKLTGTSVWCDPHGQTFPGAYKGIPESTQFKLMASSGTWKLVEVVRSRCNGSTQGLRINLSDEAKENILAHLNGVHEW